jgi:ATP-dependent protease ClpP protease subunit
MNQIIEQCYKRRRLDDEDSFADFFKPSAFKISKTPIATKYTVDIDEPFYTVGQLAPLVRVLDEAEQGDVVELKLTTPGGNVGAVLPLLASMTSTNAQVLVHAISDVASAGTFLLMLADDVCINPYVTVMFHQVTFGAFGPGNNVEDRVNHTMRQSKALLRDIYKDFFTPAEIDRILSGTEVWMEGPEFYGRLEVRNKVREAAVMTLMDEAQVASEPEQAAEKPKRRSKKQATE